MILALGLTGCWDQLPFTNRASVLIITIAPAAKARQWRWEFYFPNPTITVSSISQMKPQEQFYRVQVTASSLDQAYQLVQERLARDIYLGQLEVIVWSTGISATAFETLLDTYNREGYVSKTAYMLLARPPLSRTVSVSPQESLPSVYLTSYFECQSCQPEYLGQPIWRVWDDFKTPGVSPVLPYMASPTAIAQIGVYGPKGKPVIFSKEQTQGYAYLAGKVNKESLNLTQPGGIVTITRLAGRPKTQVSMGRHAIDVRTQIHLTGILGQWPASEALTLATLRKIQHEAEQAILAKCRAAIEEANRTHTDPFGYGRMLYFRHLIHTTLSPSQWESLPIHAQILVRVAIRSSGVSQ